MGTLIIKCSWCGASMGSKPNPGGPDGTTHGICQPCKAKL